MKKIIARLEKEKPDYVAEFKAKAPKAVTAILGNFKKWEFFTGESMDPDGMVALLDYKEENDTPYMWFFKDGLIEEKFVSWWLVVYLRS